MGCVLGPDQRATTVCCAGENVKRNRREKKLGKQSRQADELPKSKRREEAEEKAERPCAVDSREFTRIALEEKRWKELNAEDTDVAEDTEAAENAEDGKSKFEKRGR